jgi:cellulose synthase/poly-beta-1,6-N-acetylglucosamine synthase-like glycosyltransferase
MFIEVGGYLGLEHVQSGDDELLLHRMWGKGDLVYAENAVVETHSVSSWKAFWKQRKRWVSKSGDYENRRMKVTMLVAWMARFSWILSLVLWNIVGVKFVILNSIFIVLPEIILLQRWGLSSNRAAVHLVIQAVYSLYVVVIPFLSRGIKNNDKKPPWIGL